MNAIGDSSTQNQSERQKLFDYWNELIFKKVISKEIYESMDRQPIQDAIIRIMRRGVMDGKRKRHVLSLKELLPEINTFLSEKQEDYKPLKLTALYYHRDMLIEKGLIVEVVSILEGKRHVSYYGRTAKGFIHDVISDEDEWKEDIEYLKKIVRLVNPQVTEETLDQLLNELREKNIQNRNILDDWLEKHQDIVIAEDIDIIDFVDRFSYLIVLLPEIRKLELQLARYLKFTEFE